MLYEGQTGFLVGASGGIGTAIAEELLKGGCDLALGYCSNSMAIDRLVDRAALHGRKAIPVAVDLSDRDSIKRACAFVFDRLGVPSFLVNSAGIRCDRMLLEMSDEDWDKVINVNLGAAFVLVRETGRMMIRKRHGRIVNVTSVAAVQPISGQANYSASKAGLIALTKVAAREFGPFGITVNAIAPGFVETAMTDTLPEAMRRRHLSRVPTRRFGKTSDILPALRMLLSPDAGYITGQVIVVDGGLTA